MLFYSDSQCMFRSYCIWSCLVRRLQLKISSLLKTLPGEAETWWKYSGRDQQMFDSRGNGPSSCHLDANGEQWVWFWLVLLRSIFWTGITKVSAPEDACVVGKCQSLCFYFFDIFFSPWISKLYWIIKVFSSLQLCVFFFLTTISNGIWHLSKLMEWLYAS